MIEINLIPDIKQEFIKKQNSRRVVVTLATIISAAFIALVIILFSYVTVVQSRHQKNLEEDIAQLISEYQEPEDISKVLTVNGQLEALPGLHEEKPDLTRLDSYLRKLIPTKKVMDGLEEKVKSTVSIDSLVIDIIDGTINIKGQADAPVEVDKFINYLKNAVYFEVPDEDAETIDVFRVFVNPKLNSISPTDEGGANFELTSGFDVKIFSNGLSLKLTIPETSSDETEFITPQELTLIEQGFEPTQDNIFEPNEDPVDENQQGQNNGQN